MNYFVLSPNVYNNHVIDPYIQEMRNRGIVIMGYSEGASRWANMFSNTMKIGDCIIVAHGANKNKHVYFAGIISSETMPYTDTKESMYREIMYCTQLEGKDIDFNEKCAYGASNRPTSIYQLKTWNNPSDLAVANAVTCEIMETVSKTINRKTSYSLQEIATWNNIDNKHVAISSVQRGLVWKPAQVELLWDSILRGYPIGSFVLSDSDTNCKDYQYYLMDGQQRFNAISLGYNENNETTILWLDLIPKISKNNSDSTRIYWIRVTNRAHPWGFKANDECTTLTANEKREALKRCGVEKNIYTEEFKLSQMLPYSAEFPIPLIWLTKAPTDTSGNFIEYVKNKIKGSNYRHDRPENITDESIESSLKELYSTFVKLKDSSFASCF